MSKISIIFIFILFFNLSYEKDISTFSNYEIVKQTRIEVNFNIDFTQKVVHGTAKFILLH